MVTLRALPSPDSQWVNQAPPVSMETPAPHPARLASGDTWMDSANAALRVYDGSEWSQGTFIGNLEGFIEIEAIAGENLSQR